MKGEKAGLGFWSEQAMEAGHHDFKMEWEKVKVSGNHAEYGERLFRGWHVGAMLGGCKESRLVASRWEVGRCAVAELGI